MNGISGFLVLRLTPLLAAIGILVSLWLVFLCRVAQLSRQKKSLSTETLIGEIGDAQTTLEPDGFVTVRCQSYRACGTVPIRAGDRICVIGTGKILMVERYEGGMAVSTAANLKYNFS